MLGVIFNHGQKLEMLKGKYYVYQYQLVFGFCCPSTPPGSVPVFFMAEKDDMFFSHSQGLRCGDVGARFFSDETQIVMGFKFRCTVTNILFPSPS